MPIYRDAADVPVKQVITKVDSSPSRSNIEMLTRLRLIGCYIIPRVPNTTQVAQETDQSYGIFKSNYRINIGKLATYRFSLSENTKVSDLVLLVFGGTAIEE